jgi:hypothetical protein
MSGSAKALPLAATAAPPAVDDLTAGLLVRPLLLRPPRLLSLGDSLPRRRRHLPPTSLPFPPPAIPNEPAAFRSLLSPRERTLTATASAKASISSAEFRECLEDSPGLLRDLTEALLGAYDGVGAEVKESLLSLCHS